MYAILRQREEWYTFDLSAHEATENIIVSNFKIVIDYKYVLTRVNLVTIIVGRTVTCLSLSLRNLSLVHRRGSSPSRFVVSDLFYVL